MTELRKGGRRFILILVLVSAFFVFRGWLRRPSDRPFPDLPLESLLQPEPPREWVEGIAAALLVDTSGSMANDVKDSDGEDRPKIEIARRAVAEFYRKFQTYAVNHSDLKMAVALYEFSERGGLPVCRTILPLGRPEAADLDAVLRPLKPDGDTPIGDAMIVAKRDLDATGFARRHILVVTDGMNTSGHDPGEVAAAITGLAEAQRASIYFVAFDIAADRFGRVRDAGGVVLEAANASELSQTLDYLLTGKILVEQPSVPEKE